MDVFGLITIPDVLLWILAIAVGLYVYGTWPFNILSSLGYKGPKPLPFVGNMNILLTNDKPFAECDNTLKKEYGNIVAVYEGRLPTLVLYDQELIKHVLVKEFTYFCDRRDLYLRGDMDVSLLDLKGAEWKRARGLVSPFFSTSKLKHHITMLNICTATLLAKLDQLVSLDGSEAVSFDSKKKLGDFTMDSICQAAFGITVDSEKESSNPLVAATSKIIASFSLKNIPLFMCFIFPFFITWFEKVGYDMWPAGTMETLNHFTKAAIEERKRSQKDYPDFVQALLRAHEEEQHHEAHETSGEEGPTDRGKGLTDKEIMAHAATFFLAGYDTTSTALSFLLYHLADNQHWQERVAKEVNDVIGDQEITYDNLKQLTLLEMCMDESMRIYPGAFRIDRKVIDDITILGHKFPKGALAVIPVYALHHDPDLWTDPETFDPERFLPEKKKEILRSYIYMPFGTGPRNCVGMRFAVAELKIAAARLVRRYKWTVSEKTQLPISLGPGFFPVVKGGLWMKIQKREDNKKT